MLMGTLQSQQQLCKLREPVLCSLVCILFLIFALIYSSQSVDDLNTAEILRTPSSISPSSQQDRIAADGAADRSIAKLIDSIAPSTEDHIAGTARLPDLNVVNPVNSDTLSMEEDRIIPPAHDSVDVSKLINFSAGGCNIWRGDWIPHPHAPAYTNSTCMFIQENQNCIKLGRPDLGFLNWRWKPHDCELPLFNAKAFLEIVEGKKWLFIGDSVARNHFQSVLCHLAQVELPEQLFNKNGSQHWYFQSYNFTLAVAWAPFLIKGVEQVTEGFAKGFSKFCLDVVDESWGPWVHNYDYIVLSGGHWYARPGVYFLRDEPVGCNACPTLNLTDVGFVYAYSAALRTVFDFLISSKYKGTVFFRTFSPSHWQHAAWDEGGNCTQKAPLESSSSPLSDWLSLHVYKAQLEEFGKTVQRHQEYAFKIKILDVLHAASLRPDAHPGPYGHFHARVQNDCVHWCLPGAVDAWSAMLLHVLEHL